MPRSFLLPLLGFALLAASPAIAAPGSVGGFPPLDSVPRPVTAGFPDSSEERPRLAVLVRGTPREFGDQLKRALEQTHRFDLLDKTPKSLTNAWSKLVPGITVTQCRALRNAAKVDRVLICELHEELGELRVRTRMVWLDNGEVTREMAMFGKATAAKTLALQLATFVRRATPLHCQIKAALEDHVVLDVGETNGVIKGTVFQVVRHANAEHPVSVATIRVTALEAFSARADIEDTSKDLTIAPGDSAVEQTEEMALN